MFSTALSVAFQKRDGNKHPSRVRSGFDVSMRLPSGSAEPLDDGRDRPARIAFACSRRLLDRALPYGHNQMLTLMREAAVAFDAVHAYATVVGHPQRLPVAL